MDLDAGGAIAGVCPGTGDCCVAHGNPGCSDASCCEIVCLFDDFCCFAGWGADCVILAEAECGSLCSGEPCPGAGDCCAAHSGTGCQDASCCQSVCSIEPSCCEAVWDASCAVLAQTRCGVLCAPPDPCPDPGECCASHDSAGCLDEACCDLVCSEDPYCCDHRWDPFCADLAGLLCVAECAGVCPSDGDCCTAHAGPGCDEPFCCQAVCAEIPTCCSASWTAACAALADILCPERCGGTCPSSGDCCTAHPGIGCEDRACCRAVCDYDFYCCTNRWDADCVLDAEDLCPSLCGVPTSCGAAGACCTAHAAPGCEDATCCQRVCDQNAGCCSNTWSSGCTTLARTLCGPICGCPNVGDFDANGLYNLRDVAAFQRCFTGPDGGPVTSPCDCGDVTGDGDVDLLDLRGFVQILTR